MHRTSDEEAFELGRAANTVVLTKDFDFAKIVQRRGSPPAVLWLRCGNCSTDVLRTLLEETINPALELIRTGEPLVEIVDLSSD